MIDDLNVDFVPELSLLINQPPRQTVTSAALKLSDRVMPSAGQNENLEALDAY